MRVTRIVEQLITGMRVTPLMGKKLLLATGMRDPLIVEQLVTGMRVTSLLETITVSHWNASHSPNEATLLSVTGMRVASLMEQHIL
jgi:hypothetical protein